MRNIIVGTAGHIDHGKTALVKALTGIDTDRLAEEKRRGISIDLGFAHLELGDVSIGFVDVPGHERFVKNMLAGVGGIDLVLFVIAADESIKPQTREHFDICRLLGIRRGIVVLTKADLVDKEVLDLVRLEAEEFVAGSFLEEAPVVGVSSVSGEGLGELRARLSEAAICVPPKDAEGFFRLPIDRAFSMKGFGTVVTGTLLSGTVAREQEVELHPASRRLRVRGIQVYGRPADRALAGQRTALNLAGAEPSDLARGMVLAEPGSFQSTQVIDSVFELLPSARPLKHRAPVHFHSGSAEVPAEVRWLDGSAALDPGARSYARILLREPLLLLPGDRFIVRMFSPVVTIGGGTVLDTGGYRYRKGDDVRERLGVLETGPVDARVALLVRESRHGMGFPELIARTGLTERVLLVAVSSQPGLLLLSQPDPWVVSRSWFDQSAERLLEALQAFHRENPLLPGMPKEQLRSKELQGVPPFLLDALLASRREIVADSDLLRLAGHSVALKEDEERAAAAIEAAFERAGLAAPSVAEVLAKSGVEPARARSLLQMLLRERRLVRAGEDLVFHASAIARLRALLANRRGQRFTVPMFKEWTGVSRKYAIPLLEFMDRERVTRRQGDERVVL